MTACSYSDRWMCLSRAVKRSSIAGGGCDDVEVFGFSFDLGAMVDFFFLFLGDDDGEN